MSIFRKLGLASVLLALVVAGIVSCGGGSNNDQGTSFSADGFVYKDPETGEIDPEIGITGATVAVNNDVATNGVYYETSPSYQCMVIKNHLCQQTIRVARIECDFTVQGADAGFHLPTMVHNSSYTLTGQGPCSFDSSTSSSSSSVAAGEVAPHGDASIVYSCFPVLGNDQLSYLMVNQNYLPALPYTIDATCRAIGVTQSGDVLFTNDLYYPVTAIDHAECCTGNGSLGGGGYQTGTGTGGDALMENVVSSSSSSL